MNWQDDNLAALPIGQHNVVVHQMFFNDVPTLRNEKNMSCCRVI
jgi:hypothetical protein